MASGHGFARRGGAAGAGTDELLAHGRLIRCGACGGEEGEDEMHLEISELIGREPVGLPTELSAFRGGGLGCITQQVPAGPFATAG